MPHIRYRERLQSPTLVEAPVVPTLFIGCEHVVACLKMHAGNEIRLPYSIGHVAEKTPFLQKHPHNFFSVMVRIILVPADILNKRLALEAFSLVVVFRKLQELFAKVTIYGTDALKFWL